MTKSNRDDMKVVVTANGPYSVSGGVPLAIQTIVPNDAGSWEWNEGRTFLANDGYALCRCGHSAAKPFCDGTHARIAFDGAETARRETHDQGARTYDGPVLTLEDNEALCASARFCDVAGGIWKLVGDPDRPDAAELAVREEHRCPSGRLVLRNKFKGGLIEPNLPCSIGVVEDPAKACSGPLWVRGDILLESQDGTPYERRNRITLCRCGASSNKPFCDGSHVNVAFQDQL